MKTASPSGLEASHEASIAREQSSRIETKKKDKKKKKKKEKKDKRKKERKEKKRRRDQEDTAVEAPKKRKERSASDELEQYHQSQDSSASHVHSSDLKIVESSSLEFASDVQKKKNPSHNVTLLLFYQYVEPPWSDKVYKHALEHVKILGEQHHITGRMRVAKEGLNCTLTANSRDDMVAFCRSLRQWKPDCFENTEFKLTHDLPQAQRFPNLKIIPVQELVHYGLEGAKAPPIQEYHGTHLEPADYHEKLAQKETVVIDVRNHYEANIGRFDPPGSKWIDPLMRKSTEFPVWLDDPKTQEQLQGKQVLMYCTGGIRCERASALLKYKMETDPAVKNLNIQGVYQLQGGIDKYFKEFPDGGYWKGQNYVFDKRFAHLPPAVEAQRQEQTPLGQCEACGKAWDKYRGKRRCPTCGVPSLICRDCFQADQDGTRKLDRSVRCDLCKEQDIRSKKDLRAKEQKDIEEYEARLREKGLLLPSQDVEETAPNPNKVTRLYLKNMCRKNMTDEVLLEFLPDVTHIVWRTDRRTGQFFGQGWVEMATPEAAAKAVAKSGQVVVGRPIYIEYQEADSKDVWPPPNSAVRR